MIAARAVFRIALTVVAESDDCYKITRSSYGRATRPRCSSLRPGGDLCTRGRQLRVVELLRRFRQLRQRLGVGRPAGRQIDVLEHLGVDGERGRDRPEGVTDLLRNLVGELRVSLCRLLQVRCAAAGRGRSERLGELPGQFGELRAVVERRVLGGSVVSVLELVSCPASVAPVSVVSIVTVESPALSSESPPHPAATSSSAATDAAITMIRTIRLSSERSRLERLHCLTDRPYTGCRRRFQAAVPQSPTANTPKVKNAMR